MTRANWLLCLAIWSGAACLPLATRPAYADDDSSGSDEEEEFDPLHVGVRLGFWYRPQMNMNFKINGAGLGAPVLPGIDPGVLPGTSLDLQDDLGVTETAMSDYSFRNGILEGEFFFDTRWLSVSASGVAPYHYEGKATRTFAFNFAGRTISASVPFESRFEQWHAGLDVKFNLLNNRYIRLSPLAAARILAIDWEIRQPTIGLVADTSDIPTPLAINDDLVLPYAELGGEIRVGYRDFIEGDLKLSGLYVDYGQYRGYSLQLEVGVTGYLPLKILDVGLRLGYRFAKYSFKSRDESGKDFFDLTLTYSGINLSAVVRF